MNGVKKLFVILKLKQHADVIFLHRKIPGRGASDVKVIIQCFTEFTFKSIQETIFYRNARVTTDQK